MASKKTFIKVKRGILEPKHRMKLGEAWFLYLYMLDRVNWSDGVIYDWKDTDVSEELEMSLATVRNHRRRLEDEGYIRTDQRQHNLQITVNKWDSPKEKWDDKQEVEGVNQGDTQGVNMTTPSKVQGDNQGVNQGDTQGDSELTPVHIVKSIRLSDSQIKCAQPTDNVLFVGDFLKASGISGLKHSDQGNQIIEFRQKYGDAVLMSAAEWLKEKKITNISKAISSLRTALPNWTIPDKRASPKSNTAIFERNQAVIAKVLADAEMMDG